MVAQPFGVKVLLAVLFWCGALAFIGSFLARNTKLPVVLAHTAHEIGTGWLVFTLYMVLCLIIFDLFRLFNFPCKYGFYISLFLILSLLSYGYYNYQHPKTEVFNIVINKQTVHNEQPLKVVSVSDVHLGYGTDKKELKQYVEMINAQQPDLILIGGDLIDNSVVPLYEEKKMEEMEVTFLMDRFGYMRTIDKSAYERNKEAANAENKYVFNCMNTDKICIFTDNGKMHSIKVADIPLVRFRDKGTPADNLSNYDSAQERMLYVAPLASVKENTLLFVTAASMCKLVSGAEFDVAKRTIVSTKLAEEDSLIFVGSADEMEQVVFQSEGGYFLRFQKQDISAMKKTSIGVRGMKLAEGDKLDHAYLLESRQEYTITYHEKPYVLNRIKLSKRDSKGTKPRI